MFFRGWWLVAGGGGASGCFLCLVTLNFRLCARSGAGGQGLGWFEGSTVSADGVMASHKWLELWKNEAKLARDG